MGEQHKQGFLTKEGGGWKSWKKRFFVLRNGELRYSKKPEGGSLGIISLSGAGEIQACEYKRKEFCFSIPTASRTWYMCAASESDRESWVSVLSKERVRVNRPQPAAGPGGVPAPPKPLGIEDFLLMRVIGQGSFGKVFQVRKKDNDQIYAMKVLTKSAIIQRGEVQHTMTELNILKNLVHPFLVNMYYSFQTPDKLCFVMDFVNGGELFSHLQREKRFSEARTRFYCAEITLGLEYLHNMGIIYRDLKPENLLLTDDGHICMTDFGISKQGLEGADQRTTTFCGTPEYLAPEILQGQPYGKAIDWWSLGTLMYEMLSGLPPFYSKDVQQMYKKILSTELQMPPGVSPECKSIIAALLERDPNRRIQDPLKIKGHPFYKPIDWDKLIAKELAPPFVPVVRGKEDVGQVAAEFTEQEVRLSPEKGEGGPLDKAQQDLFKGFDTVKKN